MTSPKRILPERSSSRLFKPAFAAALPGWMRAMTIPLIPHRLAMESGMREMPRSGSNHFSILNELRHDAFDNIDRHRKANPGKGSTGADDLCIHSDELS